MPQFDASFYFSQIFWMCVAFGLLFWAIQGKVMPILLQLKRERDQKVNFFLEQAASIQATADALFLGTEKILQQARSDAKTAVSDALAISRSQVQSALYAHQVSYRAQMEELKRIVESERSHAWKTLHDTVPELCDSVIEKWSASLPKIARDKI
jgi:F-type H+-transporting ATPase subunit b